MEAKPTDVISRLESAVSAWSEEMQSAHLDLERRLADAATKLAHEVEGGLLDTSPLLEALDESQGRMDDLYAGIRDVAAHVRGLEQRLAAIESAGRDREATERAVAELSARVDQASAGRDWAAELNQLHDEVAALRSDFSGDVGLSEIRAELEELRKQVSNQPTDEALVKEFANVGKEVSRLRSALKELGVSQNDPAPASESFNDAFDFGESLDLGDIDGANDGNWGQDSSSQTDDTLKVSDDALKRLAFDDSGHRRRLGDILTAANAITSGDLDEALECQSRIPTSRIGSILVELGLATELTIARVLSAQLQLPYVELNEDTINDDAVALMNPRLARHHQCIPVKVNGDTMTLAMANPLDLIAIEDVELATKKRVDPVVATQSQVAHCIEQFYGPKVEVEDEVADLDEV